MKLKKLISLFLLAVMVLTQVPALGMDYAAEVFKWMTVPSNEISAAAAEGDQAAILVRNFVYGATTVGCIVGTVFLTKAARYGYNYWKRSQIFDCVRASNHGLLQQRVQKNSARAESSLHSISVQQAVSQGNLAGAAILLAHGVSPNGQFSDDWLESDGKTSLVSAVVQRQTDFVALLMATGAQPTIADNFRRDAHAHAANLLPDHIIRQLLQDKKLACMYVVKNILPQEGMRVLSTKTKKKLLLRMFPDKPMRAACIQYMAQGDSELLKKELVKNNWTYRHFGKPGAVVSKRKNVTRPALPKNLISTVNSFLDREQMQPDEMERILKQVSAKAQNQHDDAVAEKTQTVLGNISLQQQGRNVGGNFEQNQENVRVILAQWRAGQ